MGQPGSASPPPTPPCTPAPSSPPPYAESGDPYREKGKAGHNLSFCNYLSGTACEASATFPQPCNKINYIHTETRMARSCPPPPVGSALGEKLCSGESRTADTRTAAPAGQTPILPPPGPDTSAFIFQPEFLAGEKGEIHLASKKSWLPRKKEKRIFGHF